MAIGIENSITFDVVSSTNSGDGCWHLSLMNGMYIRPQRITVELLRQANAPTPGTDYVLLQCQVMQSASLKHMYREHLSSASFIGQHRLTVGFYGAVNGAQYEITNYVKYNGTTKITRSYVDPSITDNDDFFVRYFPMNTQRTTWYTWVWAYTAERYIDDTGMLSYILKAGDGTIHVDGLSVESVLSGFSTLQGDGSTAFSGVPSEYPWPGSPPGALWYEDAAEWRWLKKPPYEAGETWNYCTVTQGSDIATGFQAGKWHMEGATINSKQGWYRALAGGVFTRKEGANSISHFRAFTGRLHVFYVKAADGNLRERIYDTET